MPPIAVYDRPPVRNYMLTAISEQTKKKTSAHFFQNRMCRQLYIYRLLCILYCFVYIDRDEYVCNYLYVSKIHLI